MCRTVLPVVLRSCHTESRRTMDWGRMTADSPEEAGNVVLPAENVTDDGMVGKTGHRLETGYIDQDCCYSSYRPFDCSTTEQTRGQVEEGTK